MNCKNWVFYWLAINIFIIFPSVGLINYIVDPLWLYSHQNIFNKIQKGFDERQQKTNLLKYQTNSQYDTLLLGSSTITYINQNSFSPKYKVFNFASSGMMPYEYPGFIKVAKSLSKSRLKTIIIGFDFDSMNLQNEKKIKPLTYLEFSSSPFYRLKETLRPETISHSLTNLVRSIRNKKRTRSYNRDNIALVETPSLKEVERLVKESSAERPYDRFIFNHELDDLLIKLTKDNADSKFIIFTAPLSAPRLKQILQNPKLTKLYNLWLKHLTHRFGEVYNFTINSKIARNYQANFIDSVHFTPSIGNQIAHIITKKVNNSAPTPPIYIKLTSKNISTFSLSQAF
jgi:hypothetical protein